MEEYGFNILMLIFAGALLLYAGLLALTGDMGLIPRSNSVKKPKNTKAYARQVAKIIALAAAAPAFSGIIGLLTGIQWLALLELIVGLVACIWAGVALIKKEE